MAVALAVIVVVVPRAIAAPLVGDEIEMVGAAATTVTLTAEDVVAVPLESVTFAVSENEPVADGVQLTV